MKTKLTLKYSSFFFCNNLQLKKGTQVEVDTDTLSDKDITILNAYISSGGIESSEGIIPVEVKEVILEEVVETPKVEETVEKAEETVVEETAKEVTPEDSEESPVKKTTRRTTKKTK